MGRVFRIVLLLLVLVGALGMALTIWLIFHQNYELRAARTLDCGERHHTWVPEPGADPVAAIPHGPVVERLGTGDGDAGTFTPGGFILAPAADHGRPAIPHGFVDLELAFTSDRSAAILARWPPAGDKPGGPCEPVVNKAREILAVDYWLTASYVVALTALCLLVGGVFGQYRRRPWNIVTALPAAAAFFDLVENSLLKRQLEGAYELALWTSLAGLAKLTLLAAALIGLLIVGFAWLGKKLKSPSTRPATPLHEVVAAEREYLAQRRARAGLEPTDHPIGLALSGGGIRSATINLGVLQALAKRGVLPRFDYLSTVSGGGYIGSALSSLLSINGARIDTSAEGRDGQYRFTKYDDVQVDEAWFTTEHERFPFNEGDRRGGDGRRGFGGSEQMRHLRTAGASLVGGGQVFGIEMLSMIGTLLPGMLYHFLHFGLFLVALSAGYLFVVLRAVGDRATYLNPEAGRFSDIVEQAFGMNLPPGWDHPFVAAWVAGFVATAIAMLLAQQLLPRLPDRWFARNGRNLTAVFAILVTMLIVGSGVLATWFRVALPNQLVNISIPLVSFLAGGAFLVMPSGWAGMSRWIRSSHRRRLGLPTGAVALLVLISVPLVLILVFTLAFFDSTVLYVTSRPFSTPLVWLVSLFAALLLAERRWDTADRGPLENLPTFVRSLRKLLGFTFASAAVLGPILIICAFIWRLEEHYLHEPAGFRLAVCGVALALFLLTGYVDFDRLSPHFLYRDRLAGAFLRTTASDSRIGDQIELLRDSENLRLQDLHGVRRRGAWEECATTAPYQLVVTCLNLTSGRQRKQAVRTTDQFIFSRLFCGSESTGFEKSSTYRKGDTTLAEAMTISGAAVNAALSAAATLLGLRLGRWLENPAYLRGTGPRRTFWTPYLLQELLASADAHHRLVYLSDGGHSGDNLGVYPLLKRRCRLIVAVDAEHDPSYSCSSLAKAISQIKIDEGLTVDIDLTPLRLKPDTGRSAAHCISGKIHYPDGTGWLFVLKSSLTGDESAVIDSYKMQNELFPHQSTADLIFDWEQFEAHRLLGEHMGDQLVDALLDPEGPWSADTPQGRAEA